MHMSSTAKKKVSVCVVTYNHEPYLRQCLQSIVDQQTDFDFEVVVGEDCSTDGTRAIVEEFAERYPDLIVPLLRQSNLGVWRNNLATHEAARGEYIAHLDGDDYALPGKLQSQADCLDANPDVSFCAHAVRVVGRKSGEVMGADSRYPTKGSMQDLLLHGTYFANSSVMYRRIGTFPQPDKEEALIDYYFHVERASLGNIYLDRRVLGAYRVHPQGMSKDIRYRKPVEDAYELAFDRALQLGAPHELVKIARLKRRMVFSIARYLSGDIDGYKEKIRLSREDLSFASAKHQILHWTRFFPHLVGMYARLRKMT